MKYIKGSALFKCHIVLPENYSPETRYQLVIGLQGGGLSPEHLASLWDDIPDTNFIYALPQAPYPLVNDTELGYDWAMWPSGDVEGIRSATKLSEEYIVNVAEDLTAQFNIGGVYLLGWSQGAIFTYLVGIKNSHLFKGLICLSGPGLLAPLANPFAGSIGSEWLPENEIKKGNDLKVFITHGKEDQAAKFELGIRSRDVLLDHGYEVIFADFVGGHNMPPKEILREIADWIKEPNQKT